MYTIELYLCQVNHTTLHTKTLMPFLTTLRRFLTAPVQQIVGETVELRNGEQVYVQRQQGNTYIGHNIQTDARRYFTMNDVDAIVG